MCVELNFNYFWCVRMNNRVEMKTHRSRERALWVDSIGDKLETYPVDLLSQIKKKRESFNHPENYSIRPINSLLIALRSASQWRSMNNFRNENSFNPPNFHLKSKKKSLSFLLEISCSSEESRANWCNRITAIIAFFVIISHCSASSHAQHRAISLIHGSFVLQQKRSSSASHKRKFSSAHHHVIIAQFRDENLQCSRLRLIVWTSTIPQQCIDDALEPKHFSSLFCVNTWGCCRLPESSMRY